MTAVRGTAAPAVHTSAGPVTGLTAHGVAAYLGIPYAAPPFGALRYAPPAPPEPWTGVRECLDYGPTAPKGGYPAPVDALLPEPSVAGTDCLNLNVWAPVSGTQLGSGLPVLVWIHGGSFVNGSGAVSLYAGDTFARDGVVCVSINYRLGVEGFGLLDGATPNRGLLDQLAALHWVQDNIAGFGGDPSRVTVAGESAGAMSVTTLLASPASRGLFHQAITQSGAGQHVLTRSTARLVIEAIAGELGIAPTAADFAEVDVDTMIQAQVAVSRRIQLDGNPSAWREIAVNQMPIEPVIDGEIVPDLPLTRLATGAGSEVAVLTGSNRDEHALFLIPTGFADRFDEAMLAGAIRQRGGDPDLVLPAYRHAYPEATPGDLLVAVISDWFFRIPALRVAEARQALGAPTWVYEFGWRSPSYDGRLGACHALEIGFVFDHLDDPGGTAMAGAAPPQSLAEEMHGCWVAFVRDGDPGWSAYGTDRVVRVFDGARAGQVATDPGSATRQVWQGRR